MNNKLWPIAVALVFLLGLGLCLYGLGGESLWIDEISHVRVASLAAWQGVLPGLDWAC